MLPEETYRGDLLVEEHEMNTIKQKIEGQSTKDTEVAPVVEEKYKYLYQVQRRHQSHRV